MAHDDADAIDLLTRDALIQMRRVMIAQVNHLSDVLGLPHVRTDRDDDDRRRQVDAGGRARERGR